MFLLILAATVTVMVSSMCSLFESILFSTRVGALEAERAGGRHSRLAARFMGMKSNIAEPTSAILVLNTVANTAGATFCGMYATQVLGSALVPAVSVVLTLAILFVGEILPKTYGATYWRSSWRFIVWPLTVMQRGLRPVIKVTQAFADLFTGSRGGPSITEDEIQASIRLGRKAGELSRTEQQLLNAVFQFDDLTVRQIMVPRTDVEFLDATWPLAKCLDVARQTRHTRFPLRRGTRDDVLGIIHVKELIGLGSGDELDLSAIVHPAWHVPETLPISRLLREMQRNHQHMALVDDEYGALVGIVTMENVLEQIVGAVQDEFDSETPDITQEDPVTFRVRGQALIERVNRECGLDLYAADVDTLSGLLVSHLGRLAEAGDRVRLEGATAEIVEVKDGRADVVRIRLAKEEEGEE